MNLKKEIIRFIGSHRFLSRRLRKYQPLFSSLEISKDFELYFDPKDLYGPSYYVMYGKTPSFLKYEKELKDDVVSYLKENDVFFDVGANIGLISFYVKNQRPSIKIHAFEPGNTVHSCFKNTIDHNHFKNVTLIKKGVADKVGVAEFFIDPKSTGGSSISRAHKDVDNNNIERIDLTSLDAYVQESGVVPNFVKVDVEGAENLVVAGAQELVKNHRPVFIIECDHKNVLEKADLWKNTFADYQFRPVGTNQFFAMNELDSFISKRLNGGKLLTDYLFVPNSKV
jgi:FkbM family methyltransferase